METKRICYWKTVENGTELYLNGNRIGVACSQEHAVDTFAMVEDGVVCWTRTTAEPTISMTMRFEAAYVSTYQMIPALQYDENNCYFMKDYEEVLQESSGNAKAEKKSKSPRFFIGNYDDNDNPWRFLWHRSSVPGATYSESKDHAVAMFMPSDQTDGAMSMYRTESSTCHELLWPEQDTRLDGLSEEEKQKHIRILEPRCVFRAMLIFAPVLEARTSWRYLLSAAWNQNYTVKAPSRDYQNLWDLGVAYTKLLYTEELDGFCGFSIGLLWNGKWTKRDHQKYEIGWCGQNASLANSLLAHAAMTGDKEAGEMALHVLDSWIAAKKPNGLIPTHYDGNMFNNGFAKTVDACNLGAAAVQLFEAADRAAAIGYDRPAYADMACCICDFAMKVMDENGRIGKSWLEEDLSPAVKEGTTGASLSMALCEGARRTNRQDYLDAAKKSCRYYIRELLKNGYTTAGALDAFTIDKESSMPLLKGNMMLYSLTGETEFLQNAEKAAWYLSTWQWHYTRCFPKGSLLDSMGFDSFGGTAVSILGGMDPYALHYVHELHDLAELTGNHHWKERASGIWRHGQMCISDGDLVIDGKAPRPAGSQDEWANVSLNNVGDGMKVAQWLVAWPTAFRLEALRRILPTDGDRKDRIL